ncbi:MAG: sigma 54-interacting transcriptional regulator [Bacilli bacterium]|nr:sigma 54-interacting transcriptional regulator [Bacilli bacterium]
MEKKIAVISPSTTLTQKITEELKNQSLDIKVKEAYNKEAVYEVEELVLKGIKVIISRGNTAKILRSHFDIPIVDIKHTFFDCYNAYTRAKLYSSKIAFLATSYGFEKILKKSIKFLNGVEIIPIDTTNKDDIDNKLMELKNKGIKVAIGGLSMERKIKEIGIKYFMTEVEIDSIREAINEALHLLKIESEREEKNRELTNKYEMINSIFNCVSEGIISIDQNGEITNLNSDAEKLFGSNLLGKNFLQILNNREITNAVNNRKSVNSLIIYYNNTSFVTNIEPIRLDDSCLGAVITVQRSQKIQTMDQKIRYSMLKKGHVADKNLNDIIGNSNVINSVKTLAKKYAYVNSTVLILGETGTGKELFAKSIHNLSNRKDAPYVAINCASFSPNLLESELFGYVKGAFTGALNEGKAGVFELAHGGTIFLDEISEASLDVQLKLLRVIQERKIVRIGDDNVIPIDVRIIAASNKDLKQLIKQGAFREDLYYRICVLELKIPPLRERKEDIPDLIRHFIYKGNTNVSSITNKAINFLQSEEWPGNIRQLGNVMERLMVICDNDTITSDDINDTITSDDINDMLDNRSKIDFVIENQENCNVSEVSLNRREDELKRHYDNDDITEVELIKKILIETRGNRRLAAEKLGISTSTLWRKIKKYADNIDDDFLKIVRYKPR